MVRVRTPEADTDCSAFVPEESIMFVCLSLIGKTHMLNEYRIWTMLAKTVIIMWVAY